MYKEFGISKELETKTNKVEKDLKEIFEKIYENALYNIEKVLMAFQKNKVAQMHFESSTGYGEGDIRKRLHRKNICRSFGGRRCNC